MQKLLAAHRPLVDEHLVRVDVGPRLDGVVVTNRYVFTEAVCLKQGTVGFAYKLEDALKIGLRAGRRAFSVISCLRCGRRG